VSLNAWNRTPDGVDYGKKVFQQKGFCLSMSNIYTINIYEV
jgi:hypothetical protein